MSITGVVDRHETEKEGVEKEGVENKGVETEENDTGTIEDTTQERK
jgi:hypothetical protein